MTSGSSLNSARQNTKTSLPSTTYTIRLTRSQDWIRPFTMFSPSPASSSATVCPPTIAYQAVPHCRPSDDSRSSRRWIRRRRCRRSQTQRYQGIAYAWSSRRSHGHNGNLSHTRGDATVCQSRDLGPSRSGLDETQSLSFHSTDSIACNSFTPGNWKVSQSKHHLLEVITS